MHGYSGKIHADNIVIVENSTKICDKKIPPCQTNQRCRGVKVTHWAY